MENSREIFFFKLGRKLPYDPTIPLMIIYPEETRIEKDTCTIMLTAALFTIARTWKQPRWLTLEKMLNITHYQRNANQNHNEAPSQAGQNSCHQNVYKQ